MNVQALQLFLSGNLVPGAATPVDLLKIAKAFSHKQRNRPLVGKGSASKSHFKLVLDAECCLDRLYGGYFSDWACGGQWNRMIHFLALLNQATEGVGLELVVFFNGSLENARRVEWIQNQLETRSKINNVLKHVATKGTPPPKIWWVPPAALRTSLKMAFRHLNTVVINSTDDHHQEVISYCRENGFHGLIADDAEYAVFNPPRHFSSQQLKLTYKGTLETKEYSIQEVLKALDLPADRLCILAALLGNHILSNQDLADFYKKINLNTSRVNIDQTVRTIANFVKDLPSSELDEVAQKIFDSLSDPKCSRFKQSVEYFINGTKDGFIQNKTSQPATVKDPPQNDQNGASQSNAPSTTGDESNNLITSGFASETAESEQESLNAYKEATANAATSPQLVIEPSNFQTQGDSDIVHADEEQTAPVVNGTENPISISSSGSNSSTTSPSRAQTDSPKSVEKLTVPESVPEVLQTALERHKKGLMSPYIHQILTTGEIKLPVLMEDENHKEFPSIHIIYRPVRQTIYAILFNLHHRLYLATKSKEKGEIENIEVPDIIVKEWIWSKTNPYTTPEPVKAEQISWGVPTIQRLWFGTGLDDKRRRLRAFLTCMKSDTQGMLSIGCVPQHLLVLACVLRYIMTFSDKIKILRRQELDAFIVQALSPELMNAQYLQDLQLSLVTTRGVQLASLFMAGVEVVLLANDACGAPIPWLMCCPWLYFDGKLFHHVLARAAIAKNLLELCNGHIDRVVKVERMRKVILEGVNPVFARSPLPVPAGIARSVNAGMFPTAVMPLPGGLAPAPDPQRRGNVVGGIAGPSPLYYAATAAGALGPLGGAEMSGPGIARGGLMRRAVPARGGQLEIAGVVVGQWGPNYGRLGPQHQGGGGCGGGQVGGGSAPHRSRLPPQVTSVGGVKFSTSRNFGNPVGNRTTYSAARGNSRTSPSGINRGKKMQMKAGMKKKNVYKKPRESERRNNPGRSVIDNVNSGLSNTFANLTLTKETLCMPGQYNGSLQNGQGDGVMNHLAKRH
ncbi:hypothetical protein QAD02_008495 [Eretmocerus hayati]|uniref:Uncharacterized protein n=1 Tax=Eretmocerus hayati TaxID=131215 RepID=A0ACC2N6Q3_9HYME|nr:hypothetical protein QAD02_008495 [Eretmocerus hayati]